VLLRRSKGGEVMVVFEGKAGIGPLRPSGDSGFVCCLSGYPNSGRPKRLPVDS
jgi:hypothetical protein